jgi:hypothetical protein
LRGRGRFDLVDEEVRAAGTHAVARKRKHSQTGEEGEAAGGEADESEAAYRAAASVMRGRETERGHTSFLTFARRGLRRNDPLAAAAGKDKETAGPGAGEGGTEGGVGAVAVADGAGAGGA